MKSIRNMTSIPLGTSNGGTDPIVSPTEKPIPTGWIGSEWNGAATTNKVITYFPYGEVLHLRWRRHHFVGGGGSATPSSFYSSTSYPFGIGSFPTGMKRFHIVEGTGVKREWPKQLTT